MSATLSIPTTPIKTDRQTDDMPAMRSHHEAQVETARRMDEDAIEKAKTQAEDESEILQAMCWTHFNVTDFLQNKDNHDSRMMNWKYGYEMGKLISDRAKKQTRIRESILSRYHAKFNQKKKKVTFADQGLWDPMCESDADTGLMNGAAGLVMDDCMDESDDFSGMYEDDDDYTISTPPGYIQALKREAESAAVQPVLKRARL